MIQAEISDSRLSILRDDHHETCIMLGRIACCHRVASVSYLPASSIDVRIADAGRGEQWRFVATE